MGGDIIVESILRVGSKFTVTLPFVPMERASLEELKRNSVSI